MDIYAIRRNNLQALIHNRANVNAAEFARRAPPLLNHIQAGSFTDSGQNFTAANVEYLLTDLDLSRSGFCITHHRRLDAS